MWEVRRSPTYWNWPSCWVHDGWWSRTLAGCFIVILYSHWFLESFARRPAVNQAERCTMAGKIKYWIVHQVWFNAYHSHQAYPSLQFYPHTPPPLSRLAGYVEALASRLGMQIPDLSPKQADMWQTRVSSHSVCISIIRSKFLICFVAVVTEQNRTSYLCVWSVLHSTHAVGREFDRSLNMLNAWVFKGII